MSVQQRTELLQALIASCTPDNPRFDATLRSCKELIDFHTYLDTHPDVVNAEWTQLKERIEDSAQFEKANVLNAFRDDLLQLDLSFSQQRDFSSRHLSFLLATSRNVLRTTVDPALIKSMMNGADGGTPPPPPTHPSEWSDYEEDSEDEWWMNDVAYSPEDGLSQWSGDEEDEEDDEIVGNDVTGGENSNEDDGFGTPRKDSLLVLGTNVLLSTDPVHSPLTPLTLSRAAHRSPNRLRRRGRGGGGGGGNRSSPEALRFRLKQPYGPTSLAVWLAAKDSEGHPARQLDPRRCFTEVELVTQVRTVFFFFFFF